jgi:hypothetical protein
MASVRPKQEFSLSAETEYSAAKIHRIFGFGRIFGVNTKFRPKVNDLLHTHSKIGKIRTKFDYGVRLPRFKHKYILTVTKPCLGYLGNATICRRLFTFFQGKSKIRHYFDFRFRWPLPNIRFWPNIWPNIRPKGSAETTFGRTLIMAILNNPMYLHMYPRSTDLGLISSGKL